MPSPTTVHRFVALVESGDTIAAMEQFYAAHAAMQENFQPPRQGRDTLIAHEREALAGIQRLQATAVRPVFIDGDHVVIRWVFEIENKNGAEMRFEELSYQRWEGECIAHEQFFYDSAQLQVGA